VPIEIVITAPRINPIWSDWITLEPPGGAGITIGVGRDVGVGAIAVAVG
jgi:hypothetical protein